jgi:16S rRNA C1402 (ribose-2'-O) methylase RsmI
MKGEFTIILQTSSSEAVNESISPEEYLRNLMIHRGISKKEAIAIAAHDLGIPKKEIYKIGLTIKDEEQDA